MFTFTFDSGIQRFIDTDREAIDAMLSLACSQNDGELIDVGGFPFAIVIIGGGIQLVDAEATLEVLKGIPSDVYLSTWMALDYVLNLMGSISGFSAGHDESGFYIENGPFQFYL